MIFRNAAYSSDAQASSQSDGYAGLAFLLRVPQVGDAPPPSHTNGLKKLRMSAIRYMDALARLEEADHEDEREPDIVTDITMGDFLHNVADIRKYLSYDRSFTNPDRSCAEAVKWVVFRDPVAVEDEVVRSDRIVAADS